MILWDIASSIHFAGIIHHSIILHYYVSTCIKDTVLHGCFYKVTLLAKIRLSFSG